MGKDDLTGGYRNPFDSVQRIEISFCAVVTDRQIWNSLISD